LVSISDAQRLPLPHANWQATVYHGLPADRYHFQPKPGGYLVFLGRISPEKRVDRAIEIARRAGVPLKIAAKVDDLDKQHFESDIRPLLAEPGVEYLGEIEEAEKKELLGNALALLFPIDWPEPFGLVMAESLACGTPVVAYDHGSVPEVMVDGVTGFITADVESSVRAVSEVSTIDRRECREHFEKRFTARRMAEDYVRVYERLRSPVAV
jgi:glycosyltransferase involved in cell wall biosynthesis